MSAEVAVGEEGGDGDGEAGHGGEQGAGDAWGDGIDFYLAAFCDDRESDHHADDRTEETKVGSAGDADGEEDEVAIEFLDFANEAAVEGGFDRLH